MTDAITTKTDEEIMQSFAGLAKQFDSIEWLIANRPLLAHYTSTQTLEKILRTDEIWFSNPLFMNDLEEMRFGLQQGVRLFGQSEAVIKASGSAHRAEIIKKAFFYYYNEFDNEHALNVYVFCLSEHEPQNTDGLLSMWRSYGGQGNGAALVFNTGFVTIKNNSPMLITKVNYASVEKRMAWLESNLLSWCAILEKSNIPDDKLYLAAHFLFSLIKIFALTFKHDGFSEEREWRAIYMPERDPQQSFLKDGFDYIVTNRGIEPKLKFKVAPLPIEPKENWRFFDILNQIILGPSIASPLARMSVIKMLEKNGKKEFGPKVQSSTIPLRAS